MQIRQSFYRQRNGALMELVASYLQVKQDKHEQLLK